MAPTRCVAGGSPWRLCALPGGARAARSSAGAPAPAVAPGEERLARSLVDAGLFFAARRLPGPATSTSSCRCATTSPGSTRVLATPRRPARHRRRRRVDRRRGRRGRRGGRRRAPRAPRGVARPGRRAQRGRRRDVAAARLRSSTPTSTCATRRRPCRALLAPLRRPRGRRGRPARRRAGAARGARPLRVALLPPRPGPARRRSCARAGRVAYVPAACLVVRRAALGEGFDESLRVGEDVDLVWRLDAAGWLVRYDAGVVVDPPRARHVAGVVAPARRLRALGRGPPGPPRRRGGAPARRPGHRGGVGRRARRRALAARARGGGVAPLDGAPPRRRARSARGVRGAGAPRAAARGGAARPVSGAHLRAAAGGRARAPALAIARARRPRARRRVAVPPLAPPGARRGPRPRRRPRLRPRGAGAAPGARARRRALAPAFSASALSWREVLGR